MTKAELVKKILEKTEYKVNEGINSNDISQIINVLFETIGEELLNNGSYSHDKFGTFKTKVRGARQGRNPKTGESLEIKASVVAKWSPSPALKKQLKNNI